MKLSTVTKYMKAGMNIMITGPAGTGKTSVLTEAARKLGWKMKYYSASTLDAQADLLGIPVPNREKKSLEYYRPQDIDEAEVVFFDEVNRTDDRTIASIFEITQFRTINGVPLPNLKSVCVALNPAEEGYNVRDLDVAFVDRFDLYLEAPPKFDYPYFSKKFGSEVAKVAKSWWEDYHQTYVISQKRSKNSPVVYISPRRMEKMLEVHKAFGSVSALRDSLPIGATANVAELHRHLLAIRNGGKVSTTSLNSADDEVTKILRAPAVWKRRDANAAEITQAINHPDLDPALRKRAQQDIALTLSSNISASRLIMYWLDFITELPTPIFESMSHDWQYKKKNDVKFAIKRRRSGVA